MTERDGQKWTLADFRRHVPHIIAEHIRAEARVAELEAENAELTAASKRMYDKWMACFDAARKAEADRDATIQRVRELWQRIDSATTINVIRQSLADELLAALDATGDNERTDQ